MIHADRDREDSQSAGIGARIAVYPDTGMPEIMEAAAAYGSAAEKFSRLVCEKVRELGGFVPEEAVREIVENLVHADYKGVVISIFDGGCSLRVSDKGPGIGQKERAFEFGFSSADSSMTEIRGVGAGLGMARAAVQGMGGTVTIEDNMGGGTVATISVPRSGEGGAEESTAQQASPQRRYPDAVPRMEISERQEKVLITVLECGEIGPSTVAEHLEISVSTAYRDLSLLQDQGLLHGDESGKRVISPLGRDLAAAIIQNWVQ